MLDLCCGHGYLTHALSKRSPNIRGVDFSEKRIAKAKDRYPRQVFNQSDAIDWLEQDDTEYNAICLFDSLEHFTDLGQERLLKSIRDSLREPNGTLFMTIPNSEFSEWYSRSVGDDVQPIENPPALVCLIEAMDLLGMRLFRLVRFGIEYECQYYFLAFDLNVNPWSEVAKCKRR